MEQGIRVHFIHRFSKPVFSPVHRFLGGYRLLQCIIELRIESHTLTGDRFGKLLAPVNGQRVAFQLLRDRVFHFRCRLSRHIHTINDGSR